jgi:hypothetical protein
MLMLASSSSRGPWSGAAKHARKDQWTGAIAFANIGLAGEAMRSEKGWKNKHRPALLKQFTALLNYKEPPLLQ